MQTIAIVLLITALVFVSYKWLVQYANSLTFLSYIITKNGLAPSDIDLEIHSAIVAKNLTNDLLKKIGKDK